MSLSNSVCYGNIGLKLSAIKNTSGTNVTYTPALTAK